jgi:signal transduction histidine kinase
LSDRVDDDEVVNQQLLRQQIVLSRFGELALRSDDLDEILTEACRLVGEALGTDLAKVVELQEDGKTLRVRAGVGWKPGVVGVASILASDDTSEGIALQSGGPMISPDIATETRFNYAPFLVENGVRAVANVIIIGGKDKPPFGILQVDSREPRQFTENDTTFLSGYANLLAAAVDRLRLLKDLRNRDAQLVQSQKLEAIGRLAAGVAHDFNNILQSVTSGLELMLDDAEAGSASQALGETALNSARRGSYLTQHLLSYARKQMLQPKLLDIAQFLTEMERLLSRTLGTDIVVKSKIEKHLPHVFVDPGQLQTALLNFAFNAAYAMPAGGMLLLEGYTGGDKDRCVVIAVTDTGVGMDEATLAQAFEPFFTTKGLEGSGLGLSMVQGFAEQSGGSVAVESVLGKGTKVQLRLPAALPKSKSEDRKSALAGLRGSGLILVVDDTPEVLMMMAVALERAGFQVARAMGGRQAIAHLESGERFDVLLTDYAMPGMNGAELIGRVRAIQPELAILVVTGFAEGITAEIPEGVEVIRKPFQREELVEAILRTMGQAKGPP